MVPNSWRVIGKIDINFDSRSQVMDERVSVPHVYDILNFIRFPHTTG
ncbi:hypothetical protein [Rhodohalobacter sp.]|nr:hypothetical protein [Rhodohalobacter sp.]MDZ7756604.1 hypothetical protein [Rhodohalobacter sp.]